MSVGGKIGYLGGVAALLSLLESGSLRATDVVFKNGQQARNVRIIPQGDEYISVVSSHGSIRYPISAVETIDGRPPGRAAAPGPAAPDGMAGPTAPAANARPGSDGPAAASAQTPAAPAAAAPDRWNFEFLLLGLLAVGGIWMRGLQVVQRDLFERRVEPRPWTLAALLLPGVGAGAYLGARWTQQKIHETKIRKIKAGGSSPAASEEPITSGTGLPFSFNVPKNFDPASHLAKKGTTRRGLTFLDTDRGSIAIGGDDEAASGLDNANEVLEEALLERASDIHIEPTSNSYRVRFRLDGILHERMSFDSTDGIRLVTAIKSLSQIDISEKRRAQDGKFRVRAEDREVDFRVATANSIYGEKLVIRVLDHRGGVFDLTSLGMAPEMLARFNAVVHAKNGMILATGPTGSGKTSTLYAALRQLNNTSLNIMTIEDPAEYELPGATQIAVNVRAGITYEAGLRSILRQDPDVILVGEMRDAEASNVALRAALTGHLVLSTLHTKDAIGTISRLQDMGIERYQLASALLMVVAQRLVRVLCPECRAEYPAVGNELESLGFSFEAGQPLYAARGCDACLGTGFRGRTGLFELLVLDDEFRRVIGEGADEAALTTLALRNDFKSFRYDGAEKVLLGITTVDEVIEAS